MIVVAIIAVLATLAIVALNPVRRYQESRNAKRWNDADAIAAAVQQYVIDNDGDLPVGINTVANQIGTCATGGDTLCVGADTACLNLGADLTSYLKSMPIDPLVGTNPTTGYSIVKDANNFITVKSCQPEGGASISVSR